jgi:NAD(P)-dependent dehydrogenase (short-subunit alcohol dehydrogenase family)/cyclophilin family peptidyl-prolyl cis-trans isomerase
MHLVAAVLLASTHAPLVQAFAQQQAAIQPRPGCSQPGSRRVVFVTGSTDGLGRDVADKLAAAGAHIIIHGRNLERGDSVVRAITLAGKGSACFYQADLASLDQVRALGAAILRDYQSLHVLVNNAGIGSTTPPVRTLSADGHELRFAVNYLAGFLLTRTLLPLLEKSAPSRIVNVASVSQAAIDFDDVMIERNYSGSRAYGQSKLSQIMFTFDLAGELAGKNVLVNVLHPATYMPTNMVRLGGFTPRATIDEGAEAVLNLINAADIGNGGYFSGLRPARANAQAYDEAVREKLRTLSYKLTGAPGGEKGDMALLLNPSHEEWRKPAPPVSHLRFETSKGVFVLELVREWGPLGADRLYNLARLGYYNDVRFHRVNPNYIVQWGLHGDSAVNAAWKDQYLRDDPPRSRNVRGSFAFSYKGPGQNNTRNTQLYVNLSDNSRNDGEPFTILGNVIEGMSVLESLYSGYGENSGSGVRQGRQGPLENGGNAFMDREYPLLDRTLRVTVSEVWRKN